MAQYSTSSTRDSQFGRVSRGEASHIHTRGDYTEFPLALTNEFPCSDSDTTTTHYRPQYPIRHSIRPEVAGNIPYAEHSTAVYSSYGHGPSHFGGVPSPTSSQSRPRDVYAHSSSTTVGTTPYRPVHLAAGPLSHAIPPQYSQHEQISGLNATGSSHFSDREVASSPIAFTDDNYMDQCSPQHIEIDINSPVVKPVVASPNVVHASNRRRTNSSGRHKCTQFPPCNADFTTSHNLRNHVKSHLGERNFQCPYCHAKTVTASDTKRHMKTCRQRPLES